MKTKGFNFLVCVDGSEKSLKCLSYAFKLATNQNDKIIVCHAPSPET